MNQQTKPWYLSKGFVGPLVTAVLFSLRNLGIADIDTDTALGILYQGAEFAGIIAGMAGRAMAQKSLSLGPVATDHGDDGGVRRMDAWSPMPSGETDTERRRTYTAPGEG
jgi:hypothetical protein